MPLYAPSSGGSGRAPNVIVGECNTPPSGTGEKFAYDTWYDETQADITGSQAAALAAIGLTYAAGEFTTTEAGVWAITLACDPIEAPTDQISAIVLSSSQYGSDDQEVWDDATFPLSARVVLLANLYLAATDNFYGVQLLTGTVTGTTVISYATITITRVL